MPPGQSCLELGCGGGKTLRALASAHGRVVGLDTSREGLRACARPAPPTLDLVQGDACALPFRDGAFGLVVAHHILEHLYRPEREDLAKEARRVLRPGGSLRFRAFSREDMRCGKGEEVEPGTFLRADGIIYHYFMPEEVPVLFAGLRLLDLQVRRSEKLYHGGRKVRAEIEAVLLRPED